MLCGAVLRPALPAAPPPTHVRELVVQCCVVPAAPPPTHVRALVVQCCVVPAAPATTHVRELALCSVVLCSVVGCAVWLCYVVLCCATAARSMAPMHACNTHSTARHSTARHARAPASGTKADAGVHSTPAPRPTKFVLIGQRRSCGGCLQSSRGPGGGGGPASPGAGGFVLPGPHLDGDVGGLLSGGFDWPKLPPVTHVLTCTL